MEIHRKSFDSAIASSSTDTSNNNTTLAAEDQLSASQVIKKQPTAPSLSPAEMKQAKKQNYIMTELLQTERM